MKLDSDKLLIYKSLLDKDFEWLYSLPLKIYLENNFWAIHGGLESNLSLQNQNPKQIVRTRYINSDGKAVPLNADKTQPKDTEFWAKKWKGPESIIYGHVTHKDFEERQDRYYIDNKCVSYCLGIDTGCVFGGYLTAAIHIENDMWQLVKVKAKQKYCDRILVE